MILKDELYHIINIEKENDKLFFDISLNKNHFIYKAHFPNFPITPGVCLVQIGTELLSTYFQKKYKIKLIKSVKFLSTISPEMYPCIKYVVDKLTIEESNLNIQMQVLSQQTPLCKLSFVCNNEL